MRNQASLGFTLLELVMVMAVVAILATIALPSYEASVRKSRRTEARAAVSETAQRLERCLTQFGSYDEAAGCTIALPYNTPAGYYSVDVARTPSTFTVNATAQGVQVRDTGCFIFSLGHTGQKTARKADTSPAADCW